jgi:hypothetical protein
MFGSPSEIDDQLLRDLGLWLQKKN